MPFPSNKITLTPFSHFLSLLHSPKRTNSLVVHTGFPTSLIDLFLKNRTRFKKHSPPPPPPPPSPPSPATTPTYQPISTIPLVVSENDDVSGRVSDRECGTGVAVLVKILVVLALIACVERLTVWITVLAFALVFLQYAGKRVVSLFSNANVAKLNNCASIEGSVSVSACVSCFQKVLQLNNCEAQSVQLGSTTSIDEIEVVESNCEESFFVDSNELDCVDESPIRVVKQCGIYEHKTKGNSRSYRFKSKLMKKFMPKKFLYSKKQKEKKRSIEVFETESGSEILSVLDEEESSLLVTTKLDYGKEEVINYGITCYQKSLLGKEEVKIERDGNSGFIILVVIALVGLVMGLFSALILIITWCFILKLVKTL
ncbi:hypothetical protein TanjilG_31809 [Lupinus angustifolius]|uniref:Uncharacterized protein n=1 Tax=Lupinus angustifolius TaxID=3871 RepID=A0A4P1RMP2_LUPAN|nr:PREDICTED: uncharacterized protein LOC109344599 [Lupinus angustifolius]OIW13920.1 hypothetical protein TanjilG_31809 [Lupinus angustifolius]